MYKIHGQLATGGNVDGVTVAAPNNWFRYLHEREIQLCLLEVSASLGLLSLAVDASPMEDAETECALTGEEKHL